MGWGRLGYRHKVYTGVGRHGGRSNQQTRKPTEAVRHRVGLEGQRTDTGGSAGAEGEEAHQTSEGNRGDAEQSDCCQ
jgi:hypothetical protein